MIQRTIHIPEDDAARIVERPDGFYWVDPDSGLEFGPFPTVEEARADMESASTDESGYEPGESAEEAEAELGISDWIDPETGEPAEDSVPRLED